MGSRDVGERDLEPRRTNQAPYVAAWLDSSIEIHVAGPYSWGSACRSVGLGTPA